MHGSVSGPLGALLLIAPLAAIPVFAIVGVPQFSPLVAESADDDEYSSPPDLGDSTASLESTADEPPAGKRIKDDIFAPLPDSGKGDPPVVQRPPGTTLPEPRTLEDRGPRSAPVLPPAGALDNWEIRPETDQVLPGKSPAGTSRGSGAGMGKASRSEELQI